MAVAEIPIWHKLALSQEEAAAYTNLNIKIIRGLVGLANIGKSNFPVFFCGTAPKIPRVLLEEWVAEMGAGRHKLELDKIELAIEQARKPAGRGRPRKAE